MAQREMPNHADIEERILGCLMEYPKAIDQVPLDLRPDDFYQERHRQIFAAMRGLASEGKPVSAGAVKTVLGDNETTLGLITLQEMACIPGELAFFVDKIKATAVRRQVIEFGRKAARMALDNHQDTHALLAGVEGAWLDFTRQEAPAGWLDQRSLMMDHLDTLQERAKRGGMVGIPSGFTDLDHLVGGWQPGHLIFLAAVPKMGKTSLGLHFALHSGVPTIFFTMEMMATELADRQISARGKVDSQLIRIGHLSPQDAIAVTDAAAGLFGLPIGWVEKTGLTVAEIRSLCRRFQVQHGLGLVVIDQLDKIAEPARKGEKKTDQIGRVTGALKAVSRELKCPVICLVQLLDKAAAGRRNPRPIHGDVRDSSYPDQDCDVMLYVWRPEFYWPKKHQYAGKAEIIIARQRSGPQGSVWVEWHPRYTSFSDLDLEEWPKEDL